MEQPRLISSPGGGCAHPSGHGVSGGSATPRGAAGHGGSVLLLIISLMPPKSS